MKERDARRHERNENKAQPSLWALKNALPHFVRAVNRREAWGRAFEVKAFCATVHERLRTAGSDQDLRSNS